MLVSQLFPNAQALMKLETHKLDFYTQSGPYEGCQQHKAARPSPHGDPNCVVVSAGLGG
jgi:hypothetical protein